MHANGEPVKAGGKLADRLAAAQKRKAAAEGALTAEVRADIAARDEIARIEADALAAERMKRDHDLEMRLDAAREALGKVKCSALSSEDFEDTFVVQDPGSAAYNKWEKDIAATVTGGSGKKPMDRAEVTRSIAVSAVYDWNGTTDFSGTSEGGFRLIEFLKAHPAIATLIQNEATRLAGLSKEERKSGR